MQKWCPEPFAPPVEAPQPAATNVFRSVAGTDTATDESAADVAQQFRRETGYADPRSLLATLTRRERTDLFELAEADVASTYEARQAELAAAQDARLAGLREESAAQLAAFTAGLEAAVRDDLARAAAAAARLAIQVACKIVRGAVAVDHGVLTRALETILYRQQAAAPLHVFVSPADALWLAEAADLRTRLNIVAVSEDRRLDDGSCRVRSEGREWDLTIDGQLATLQEIVDEALATTRAVPAAPTDGAGDGSRLD